MVLPGDFGSTFEETPQAPAPLLPRQAPLTEKPGALPGDFGEMFRKPSVSIDAVDQNLHLTRGVQPDAAAKDKQLGLETGFDPELVGRNRDFARSVAERNSAMSILADAPGTTRFLSSDRLNTAIAKDDLGTLAGIEGTLKSGWDRLSTGYDVGTLSTELSRLRYAQNMGDESPATAARVAELKQKMQMLAGTTPANLFERGAKATGEQTPIQMEIARVASIRALEGSAAGAAVGTWVFPGLGTAGGALAGAGAGVTSGTIEASFMLETGSSYDEFLDAGMGKETAMWASRLYGAAAAAIETISLGPLKRMIPGLSGTTDAAKVPVRQTIKRVVLDYTKNASKVQLAESFEEGLQTVLQDVAQWAGERWEGKDPTFDWAATLGKAREAMIDTMLVPFGPAIGAPKLGMDISQVRAENRQAEAAAKLGRVFAEQAAAVRVDGDMARMDELRAMAQESKLRQRDPASFEAVIQHQIDEHPDNAPAEVLISGPVLAQAVSNEPSFWEWAPKLGLEQAAVAEAAVTGADVSIPFSKYLAHMVGTPLDATVAKDMRLRRGAMTINERDAWMKESEKDLQSIVNEATEARARNTQLDEDAMRIEQVIGDELAAAANRGTAAVAPQNAKVYSAFFTTMAARGWLDHTHGGSAWNAFRATWPTVQSVDRRTAQAGQGLMQQDHPAMAGVDFSNPSQVAEAEKLWAEMGVESPYFKKWFGDSKVVGQDGKPLVVYHGSAHLFDLFNGALDGVAGHFTTSPEEAYAYAKADNSIVRVESKQLSEAGLPADPAFGDGPATYPVYLSVKNPFDSKNAEHIRALRSEVPDVEMTGHYSNFEDDELIIPALKKLGFDGFYAIESATEHDVSIAVFDPTQIKSVFNRGTFDASDPRILHQDAASTGATPDARQEYFKNSAVRDAEGKLKVLFHGAQRADRVNQAEKFSKDRATSGPMAFFTDDPEIASGYATGKQDTSLEVESLEPFFKVNGKNDFKSAWYSIDPAKRFKIKEMAHRIGQNEETGSIEIVMRDGDKNAGLAGRSHFEYELKQAGGNAIKALYEMWVNSGAIFGEEARFTEVLRTAGIDDVVFEDPYATFPGVFPVYMNITNPLDTAAISKKVVAALKKAAKANPAPEYTGGVDGWDKRGPRGSGENWFPYFERGLKEGDTLAWTVVPDWVTAELKRLGYDGIKDTGGKQGGRGHEVWIPFEENQVKSIFNQSPTSDPRILMQSQASAFFSQLERVLDAKLANGTASQHLKTLDAWAKKGEFKGEELEWSGLREWLAAKGDEKVSKAEVLDFLRQGGVKIEEVVKGAERDLTIEEAKAILANGGRIYAVPKSDPNSTASATLDDGTLLPYIERSPGSVFLREGSPDAAQRRDIGVKFDQYQLPGGEKYRELLLTLPPKETSFGWEWFDPATQAAKVYATEEEARSAAPAGAVVNKRETGSDSFRSSHFSEPNILAHVRFNERTDAEGKRVLFIEEIQSDWAQKGRKEGFDAPIYGVFNSEGILDATKPTRDEALTFARENGYPESAVRESGMRKGTPNAPFVKNTSAWSMLAMKRMIRWAAENGFERVAWTTGEQQAERYDLSKQISAVEYEKNGALRAWDHNGEQVMRQTVEEKDLPDAIGKEAAEKLLAAEPQSFGERRLEGVDLKVGGEGMKGFYDKILPNETNKLIKKWGAKVGETRLEVPDNGAVELDVEEDSDGRWYTHAFVNGADTVFDTFDTKAQAEAAARGEGPAVHSFDITPQMREGAMAGQALFQGQQNSAHAMVTFGAGPSGTPVVTLFETANESSFLHESGHIFLDFLKRTAETDGAPKELSDLWAGVSKEIGHEGGEISVDAHEKWARALEMYFREGKTPSRRLVHVFQTFASWLRKIYSALTADGYKPSPELSSLFDRLFATDAEIQEVEALHEARKPFFSTLDNMAEAERQKYEKLREKAAVSARDKALARYTDAYIQALGGKEAFLSEARKEADGIPVYKALKYIAENGGLELAAVEDLMGEEARAKLVKKTQVGAITKNGALDPDRVAEMHGFKNGEEMLSQVLAAEGKTPYVKRRADEMMKEKKESVVRGLGEDGVLAAEVDYHNEDRLAVLVAEAEMLRASSARAKGNEAAQAKTLEAAAVREVAKQALAGKPVSKAVSYAAFSRAELTAGRNARRAMDAGKTEDALSWKRQEMLNHALVLEAIEARERVRKGVAYVKGKVKSKTIEQEARDLITDIAVRFGFNPRPPRTTLADVVAGYNEYLNETDAEGNKRKEIDFQAWATTNAQKGHGVVLTPLVTDRSNFKEYEDLTLAEFDEVIGAAKQIAHVDLEDRTYKTEAGRIALEQVVGDLVGQLEQTFGPKARNQFEATKALNKIKGAFREADASLVKMELLFKVIDGGKMGPWFKYIMDRANVAAETEDDRMHKAANDLSAMMHKHYNARERANMFGKRVHIPELGHSMTKAQLLRVLMDFGNEGNYIRRRDGNGWTDEQMDALKKYADKRDWEFIQETWEYIDTYRPEAFALHKATTGVEPERIMPRPVETPHGTYAGGYFPSVMDKKENNTAKARQQIEDSILYGTPNFAFVQTKQGHLKQRAKNAGGQVLSIEMSDLTDHVFGVIHDITHREAAMNVAKVFRNKTFVTAVEERLGKEYADLLIPWIKDIANTPIEPVTRFEKMFRAVRLGTTVARLGKIAVGLQQAAGLTQTVAQMKGDSWRLAATLGKYMVNPVAFYKDLKFANDSSSFMRHRITTATRETTDAFRGLSVKDRYLSQPGRFMLKFLGGVQKMATDVPSWNASYAAELKRSGDHAQAVKHADQIVRISQGSGQVKDLTAIQRSKSEMVKSITMFYSFLSSAYAQITNPLRGKKPHFGEFMLTTTMLALIGPSLAEILSGRGPDDEDDDGNWAIWAARNSLQFSLSLVPGVKDVAGSVMSGFGYKMSPVESPIQSAVYLLRHLPQAIEDDEYEKIAKPALDVLGVWAKLPSDQLYITSVAALKLLEDDPSYTYLDLVYKHKKD